MSYLHPDRASLIESTPAAKRPNRQVGKQGPSQESRQQGKGKRKRYVSQRPEPDSETRKMNDHSETYKLDDRVEDALEDRQAGKRKYIRGKKMETQGSPERGQIAQKEAGRSAERDHFATMKREPAALPVMQKKEAEQVAKEKVPIKRSKARRNEYSTQLKKAKKRARLESKTASLESDNVGAGASADAHAGRDAERKVADEDDFDIDIYGDAETRRKYEPLIKNS